MRCIYKMHAQNPTKLENEPRYIDPTRLTGIEFSSSKARTTILGFNGILWAKDGLYANQGEEVVDISPEEHPTQRENLPSHDSTVGPAANGQNQTGLDSQPNRSTHEFGHDQHGLNHLEETNTARPRQAESNEHVEPLTQAYFQPFLDPEMLGYLPDVENLDLGHFEAYPLDLDYFDTPDFLDTNWATL